VGLGSRPIGTCMCNLPITKNYYAICLVLLYAFNRCLISDFCLLNFFFFFFFPFCVVDPCGAQAKVLEIASSLGLSVSIAVAHEISVTKSGILGHINELYKYCQITENHYHAIFIVIKVNTM
jgi:hypothetical protein